MLAVLGVASAVPGTAQSPLKFRGLDHIEFTVADVERSVAFYAQLFGGADVMKNRTTTRRYIKLGSSYMAIDRADAPRIDHACIGIENFDITAVHAFLTSKGLTYRDYPSGRDTGVNDPDGTRLQLSSADGWTSLAAQTASPELRRLAQPQLFVAAGLSSVEVSVSDLARAFAHYGSLLGPAPARFYKVGAGRLELQRGTPGFTRFTIQLGSAIDLSLGRKLEALGARFAEPPGAYSFRFFDPDGFLVEVISASEEPIV